jgi:hypothetical protein
MRLLPQFSFTHIIRTPRHLNPAYRWKHLGPVELPHQICTLECLQVRRIFVKYTSPIFHIEVFAIVITFC